MNKKVSEDTVRSLLSGVMHPAINKSLLDLGIIKEISVENEDVLIVFALPFPNIPLQIKDQMIQSILTPLKAEGIEPRIETTVMTQQELNNFLSLEQQNWKG